MRQVATPGTADVREFVYSDARHHPMLQAPLPRSYRDRERGENQPTTRISNQGHDILWDRRVLIGPRTGRLGPLGA
jgi:hypothetical protein